MTYHEEILDHLLEYRESHPDFNFIPRQRDRQNRFSKGYWFQGEESYAFVGLLNNASINMTRSVGAVFWHDDGYLGCTLEVITKNQKDERIRSIHNKILELYDDFEDHNGKFKKFIGDTSSGYDELLNTIYTIYSKIKDIVSQENIEKELILKNTTFNKFLSKINTFRNTSTGTTKSNDLSILANITWNSNNWKAASEDKSNHGYIKKGNIPNESWNFNFENESNHEKFIYGFAQFTNTPRVKNPPIIVFYSDSKIVGFYGNAEIGDYSKGDRFLNLLGQKDLSLVLENKIEDIKAKGFLEDKNRIGQIGFNYIQKNRTVINILDEAIRINPKQNQVLQKLKTWFIENTISDNIKVNKDIKEMVESNNLNNILFGPPGTGKTYNTINEALKIVDTDFYKENSDNRKELNNRFKELLIKKWDDTKGQIAFCTFHQSFSYEDFVEGIKPKINDNKEVYYKIEPGVFKNLCDLADSNLSTLKVKKEGKLSWDEKDFKRASFYKLSLGNSQMPEDFEIYEFCRDNNYISIGFGDDIDFTGLTETEVKEKLDDYGYTDSSAQMLNYFIHYLKKDNYVLISNGNQYVRALGRVTGDYEYNPNAPIKYNHFREVEWIFVDENIPVEEIYEVGLSQRTIYKIDENKLRPEFFINQGQITEVETKKEKDYVLIIDEINRGNVSSIFGELITLIETDKRAGRDEELEVILPYSKKPFKVPHNVHIIGTMNTADKSIEALDTALRRRFSFTEMPPKPKLIETEGLSGEVKGMVDEIDLKNLLKTINKRIEKLIDKDHKIGHSYFLKVNDRPSLIHCFKNEVIPLLEEYFFGDYGKIGLILGNSFITKEESDDFEFAEFDGYDSDVSEDLKQRSVYKISNSKNWDFKTI